MPMMNATLNSSPQPETKVSVISVSPMPSMSPTTTPPTRNRAESSGNHQPKAGRSTPISSKGMTP